MRNRARRAWRPQAVSAALRQLAAAESIPFSAEKKANPHPVPILFEVEVTRPTPRRRRVALAPASAATDTALDFPREQDGLHAYYELVARQTSALRRSGSRWLFDFESGDLRVEHVRPRDCYETPTWIWRFYVAREALTLDAHSSTMNAITPSYLTLASGQGASEIPCGAQPSLRWRARLRDWASS